MTEEINPKNLSKPAGPEKAYDCIQCTKFDFEGDDCLAGHLETYCNKYEGDKCPDFDPPKQGRFELYSLGS